MKKLLQKILNSQRSSVVKSGTYSAALTAIVIAIVIVFQMIMANLPESLTEKDITNQKIYTVTDTSVDYLKDLDTDITITVVASDDNIDTRIKKFLSNYLTYTDHIKLEYVDPVQKPSALTTYNTSENTIVVTNDETGSSDIINLEDVITYDYSNYYTYGYATEDSFDLEGQLTSAIDTVVNENSKKAYEMSGHGEAALSETVTEQLSRSKVKCDTTNLLLNNGIPKDCDILICNAPTADLADDEYQMIQEFMENGGRFVLMLSQEENELPNFDSLMAQYGIEQVPGYVADLERYYNNNAYIFFPVYCDSDITDGLGDNDLTLIYNSKCVSPTEEAPENVTVTPFLSTSSNGVLDTDGEENKGTYYIAIEAENTENNSRMIVFGCDTIADEGIITSYSNAANMDIIVNAMTVGFEDISNISISAKSLAVQYNTISTAGIWSVLFVIVVPVAILIVGLVHWMKRRKL